MICRMLRILMCGVLATAACSSERNLSTEDPSGNTRLIKNSLIVDGSGTAGYPGDAEQILIAA